ncbi:MAG: DUF1028 domain-containing protein [Candidatus Marinimicrobia bacterium]|jgi:uncharacterized Ntn-hydrolase superfamily protein|nr:DUF1028 domain-containing protein [Candidatus Neomarinimicrobiota bacterium]
MKNIILLIIFIITANYIIAKEHQSVPVSTYSIVAYDEETGQLGVAVQSHWFSVGSLVPWIKAGVGAVATQSFVKVEYGPNGLKLMEKGFSAEEALKILVEEDENSAVRQVGMVDARGNASVFTGENCIQFAGHIVGDNYTVQANLMASATVPMAMVSAYETAKGELIDKLMAALEAAEKEGGDIRGKQSAAIVVVSGEPTGIDWKDKLFDLRIEDHPEPIMEMRRLIRVSRAYQHANQGDLYIETGEIDRALEEYNLAAEYYPENPELPFWTAVSLASVDRVSEALLIFKEVFEKAPDLRDLIPRLIPAGLLPNDKKLIERIQKQ